MNVTGRFLSFTLLGAGWVLWLLIGLSVVSLTIMIERGWFFATHRIELASLLARLRRALAAGDVDGARAQIHGDTVEEAVMRAALGELSRGVDAVGAAMSGAKASQRLRLERNLAVLGTLGNNAPFIGLFGTVLGIIKAFHDLSGNRAGGVTVVMQGISEALVATAVGLMVAIPAVVGFNFYNRLVRAHVANVDALAHEVLAELKGERTEAASEDAAVETASPPVMH